MGAGTSKASVTEADGTSNWRRNPPISTRSQSVPAGDGLNDESFQDAGSTRKETLQRHRGSMIVVSTGQESCPNGIYDDPLMKKLEELHFFYPLMHDVEKRSGLFGTHNKRALADIQSKLDSLPALKIVRMCEHRLKENADIISAKQAVLALQTRETDQLVSTLLKSYSERAKAGAKYIDRLSKMDDLKKNLGRCQATFDECVAIIDLLNGMLPEDDKLEKLNPWVDENGSECMDNFMNSSET